MEIISNHLSALLLLALPLIALSPGRTRVRVRVRRPRPVLLRFSWALGFLLSATPSLALARGRAPLSPGRPATAAPPWSGTSGSPPPRPLVRTGVPAHSAHVDRIEGKAKEVSEMNEAAATRRDDIHPAVHGKRGPRQKITPLFPREPRRGAPSPTENEERARAMAAHPAGKGLASATPDCDEVYEVREGDSLWGIASEALDTRASGLIARYWPVVYRANAHLVGNDPGVIVPGQELRLPECER
jgi:hypothetical protein